MIPGKTYTPDDVVAMLWRWKWLIVLPGVLGLLGAVGYARTLPDRYRSEALIAMTPQRVREDLVRSTVRATLAERIQAISQQIMSRTRLEAIILDLDLYPRERATELMEEVVERMRRDVSVQVVRGDAFRVSYVSESPTTAMRVAERLAGLFIDENLRDREQLAEGTTRFLEAQLEDARQRLIEQEKRLEAYRRAHAGELPQQVQSNLAAINGAQLQIQRLVDALARQREELQMVERLIADATAPGAIDEAVVDPASGSVTGGTTAKQLEAARNALRAMLLRLKPEHPDVGRMKRLIEELERKAEQEALAVPLSPGAAGVPRTPEEAARLNRIEELRHRAERLRETIAANEAEQDRLREQVARYQARVDAAPTRETELIELTRDYDTLQRLYDSLLAKYEESKLAVNLEARQVGQQFRILDPARVPGRPFSPNRPRLYALGLAGGLGFGLALVLLIEYRDTSLKSDEDVRVALSLPVLALVPRLMTRSEERRSRRRRRLATGAATAVALVLVTAAAYWALRT